MTTTKTDDTPETSRQKFVRLANSRTTKALDAIDLIGGLSNKSIYAYSEVDLTRIEAALHGAVDETINTLRTGEKASAAFSLES